MNGDSNIKKNIVSHQMKYHYNNEFSKAPMLCGDIELIQTGEMFCEGAKRIGEHLQSCFELTFVVEGTGVCVANNITFEVQKNDCFISLKNETHDVISSNENPLRFKFLAFRTPNDKETKTSNYVKLISSYVSKKRLVNLQNINDYINDIFDEIDKKNIFSGEIIQLKIDNILIDILRSLQSQTKIKHPLKLSSENILVFNIMKTIEDNILTMKNLYELEEIFSYSYNYISALFAKVLGYTINEYFIKTKMEQAKKLLIETNLSVTDVAEKLNYSSIHTFSRSFKNFFGYSPFSLKRKK